MRFRGFVLLIALSSVASGVFGQSQTDFTGTWAMDPARSESAHQDVPVRSLTVVIRLNGPALTMETTRVEASQPTPFHETLNLKLDGSETTSAGDAGATVTAKAHWDGAKLVVETTREINSSTVTTRYVHTLSPDGQNMTVDKTLTVQHGYQGTLSAHNTGHGVDVLVRTARAEHQ